MGREAEEELGHEEYYGKVFLESRLQGFGVYGMDVQVMALKIGLALDRHWNLKCLKIANSPTFWKSKWSIFMQGIYNLILYSIIYPA